MGNIYLEKIAESLREDLNGGRKYGRSDFLNTQYYEHGSRPTVGESIKAAPLGAAAMGALGGYAGFVAGLSSGLPKGMSRGFKYGAGAGAILGTAIAPITRYNSLKSTENFDHEAQRLGISRDDRLEYINNRSDFNSELPASSKAIAVHKLLNPTQEM